MDQIPFYSFMSLIWGIPYILFYSLFLHVVPQPLLSLIKQGFRLWRLKIHRSLFFFTFLLDVFSEPRGEYENLHLFKLC